MANMAARSAAIQMKYVLQNLNNNFIEIDRGYFAYFLKKLIEKSCLTSGEFANGMNVAEGYIEACLSGDIVPLGLPLRNFASFCGFPDKSEYAANLAKIISRDLESFKKDSARKHGKKRFLLIDSLCRATASEGIGKIVCRIFGEKDGGMPESAEPFEIKDIYNNSRMSADTARMFKFRLVEDVRLSRVRDYSEKESSRENIRDFAAGITKAAFGKAKPAIERLIENIAFRKTPFVEKSFGDILDDYVELGKRDFTGFFDKVAEEWRCSRVEVMKRIGITGKDENMNALLSPSRLAKGKFGLDLIAVVAENQGLSTDQKHTMAALRYGKYSVGTIQEIVAQAQEILTSEKTDLCYFSKNKVATEVVRMSRELGQAADDSTIDKKLVPNAVLKLLLEFTSVKLKTFITAISMGRNNDSYSEIITGKQGFLIHHSANRTQTFPAYAHPAAKFFTDDKQLVEDLALVFLELGKKHEPCELIEAVRSGQISKGRMITTLRLQMYMTSGELAEKLEPQVEKASRSAIMNGIEIQGYALPKDRAERMASIVYAEFLFDRSSAEFIKLMQMTQKEITNGRRPSPRVEQHNGSWVTGVEDSKSPSCIA